MTNPDESADRTVQSRQVDAYIMMIKITILALGAFVLWEVTPV